jgi:hypothetical protein
MLKPFDIVVIAADFDDAEVRNKRGYVIGQVTPDQIGVFVYDEARVWCLHPRDVSATGEIDIAERDAPRAALIRVSSKGEVLG